MWVHTEKVVGILCPLDLNQSLQIGPEVLPKWILQLIVDAALVGGGQLEGVRR